MFRMADPTSIKVWKLLDMAILPAWVKGRLALLGESAHPMLPCKFFFSKLRKASGS